jgi:hypothetical protein
MFEVIFVAAFVLGLNVLAVWTLIRVAKKATSGS